MSGRIVRVGGSDVFVSAEDIQRLRSAAGDVARLCETRAHFQQAADDIGEQIVKRWSELIASSSPGMRAALDVALTEELRGLVRPRDSNL